ncbi:MAG: hypothetical protein ACLQPD_04440 [Desulfomonilaceae bacterium]
MEDIYERWLRERNEAVGASVKDCYEECKRMLEIGDTSEEDFCAWQQRCIHALSPDPLKRYFWEFSVSWFTKDNLRSALNLLSLALEHVNRPSFALPNLKIDCYPAFEIPAPEILLGLE